MKEFYSKSVTDAIKFSTCPKIVLPGWWWKKYFKSYCRLRVTMQDLIEYQWMHGGYEEYKEMLTKLTNEFIDQSYLSAFPPLKVVDSG